MRFLLVALFLLLSLHPAGAEALRYTGEKTLFLDAVWEGEVVIDGVLTVAPGTTLEIRPGTKVRFTRFDGNGDGIGEREIFVQGVLKAVGTAEAPILFTSAEADPKAGDWGAINMMASEEENRLEHCRIEYAYRGFHAHFSRARLTESTFSANVRAAQFQESTVGILTCRFVGNHNGLQFRNSEVTIVDSVVAGNHWGLRGVYSEVGFEGCRIEGNLVNGVNLRDSTVTARGNRIAGNRKGIYLQRCRGNVEGNLVEGNSEHGILLEDGECQVSGNSISVNGRAGVKIIDSAGALRGNRIEDNGEYALVNEGASPVDAAGNWWGSASPEPIERMIRDGRDRPGTGRVLFSPPLSERITLPTPNLPPEEEERSKIIL